MRRLVLRNQVMVGSVNASRKHFEMAVQDLNQARQTWGSALQRVITDRYPYTDYAEALSHHSSDEIKTILEWSKL
jgi:threonine dehydrogenase-like Zn-dependent dehydrogenase